MKKILALATMMGLMAESSKKLNEIDHEAAPKLGYQPNLLKGSGWSMKARGMMLMQNKSQQIKRKRLLAQKKKS